MNRVTILFKLNTKNEKKRKTNFTYEPGIWNGYAMQRNYVDSFQNLNLRNLAFFFIVRLSKPHLNLNRCVTLCHRIKLEKKRSKNELLL